MSHRIRSASRNPGAGERHRHPPTGSPAPGQWPRCPLPGATPRSPQTRRLSVCRSWVGHWSLAAWSHLADGPAWGHPRCLGLGLQGPILEAPGECHLLRLPPQPMRARCRRFDSPRAWEPRSQEPSHGLGGSDRRAGPRDDSPCAGFHPLRCRSEARPVQWPGRRRPASARLAAPSGARPLPSGVVRALWTAACARSFGCSPPFWPRPAVPRVRVARTVVAPRAGCSVHAVAGDASPRAEPFAGQAREGPRPLAVPSQPR